jgi:hypothetical protein
MPRIIWTDKQKEIRAMLEQGVPTREILAAGHSKATLSRVRAALAKEKKAENKLYSFWYKLRKPTVPAHWAFGILCAVIFVHCWPAAVVMMLLFAMFEWWNDKCDHSHQGAMDWWDSFLTFCIGTAVALILHGAGLITIRWWF